MIRCSHRLVIIAALTALSIGPAFAQGAPAPTEPAAPSVPARCTGLLCDLYYAGKPANDPTPPSTALPCHDFLCGMFGGRTPDRPAPQQAVATPEPVAAAEPETTRAKARRAHRKAKVKAETLAN